MRENSMVFVTGGGGFLGKRICLLLKERGYSVTSFSRRFYPELEELGIRSVCGDVSSVEDLEKHMPAAAYAVIHTASHVSLWGKPDEFFRINVLGTKKILACAQRKSVARFIYTSSPSVAFDGRDICGADEEALGYAKTFLSPYPYTKMLAEKEVLSAKGLAAVALRPHIIWGKGDPHFLPRIHQKAKSGRFLQVGSLKNKVDVIHVDTAAFAHVQAMEQLGPKSTLNGKAYFLGQERPVQLWPFIDQLLTSQNLNPYRLRIPLGLAYQAGALCEKLYQLAGQYRREPPMTRLIALQLAKSHYFSHERARRDWGYQPKVSIEGGLAQLNGSPAGTKSTS